ncbi:response regulator [Teredinibacter turnerae]|uniref:response regulator n=1 Tax=Teredinibacter turnerae TaxID=2426 RepID=UPI000381C6C4|nr:response regulator [Teredinibacter turnerae]
MTEQKKQVLIVDDAPTDIQFVIENLKDEFAIKVAGTGRKALEMAEAYPPVAILLDVTMPELNGYETCEKLKSIDTTKDIEVLFVSANDSIEEILKGYEVGGSDYIVKPVNPEELRRKVRLAVQNTEARFSVVSEKKAAMEAAMTAIMDASEQAFVVGFLRQSFNVTSFKDLAKLTVEYTNKFGLANTVQIRGPWETTTISSSLPIAPLESELMYRLADSGRILEKGKRLILNFPLVSQLIKNMPNDAPDKCGRLRDHLALIIEGASNCAKNILVNDEIARLIEESNETLLQIQKLQTNQKETNMKIMDRLMDEVQQSFLTFGMSEEQEDLVLSKIRNAVDDTLDNFEAGLKIDEELKNIVERLEDATVHMQVSEPYSGEEESNDDDDFLL